MQVRTREWVVACPVRGLTPVRMAEARDRALRWVKACYGDEQQPSAGASNAEID